MTALRLIDALPDFGTPARGDARPLPLAAARPPEQAAPEPVPDIAEIVRAEVALAEQGLAARLAAEHEAALLAERQRHADEIEALNKAFGAEAGALVFERLAGIEREIGEHVSATVARLIGGVLSDDLQKRSIDGLARAIHAALGDDEAVRIEVRGPQSLFAGLATALAGRAANLHHVEAERFDLSVTVDGTVIETRLSEWSAVLSEILT